MKAEREAKEDERGHKLGGTLRKALDGIPEDKAQSNNTDPESRIMKTKDGYEQDYNCQAAVESDHQVIVAQAVTSRQNDGGEFVAMVEQVGGSTGEYPAQVSANANYGSETNFGRWRSGGSTPGSRRGGRSTAPRDRRARETTSPGHARWRCGRSER